MENSATLQLLYHRLPQTIKNVLVAPETGEMIFKACTKHGIAARVSAYSGLVGMVLLGELHPNLLVKNIVEKEGLDIEKAKAVAIDISVSVFQPVKQELISLYGISPKAPDPIAAPEPPKQPVAPSAPPPTPAARQENPLASPPPPTLSLRPEPKLEGNIVNLKGETPQP